MSHLERFERLDRRTFVRQLSRTAVGFVVLGGAAVACGSDDGADPAASPSPDPSDGATSAAPTEAASPVDLQPGWHVVDRDFVAAYVLVRAGEAIVVDTATSGSHGAIGRVLEAAGSSFDDVSDVIVTHRHPDHAGSVPAVLQMAADATAWAGAEDIDAITAPRQVQPAADGALVAGLRIIATPGHTAGHIAVLDEDARVLVAGDAVNGAGGDLFGPNPDFSQDMDQAWSSVGKLAELATDLTAIYPGHGGAITEDAAPKLRTLAQDNA